MESENCTWHDLFDEYDRRSLNKGLFITGLISVAMGLWLNLSLLVTRLRFDRSYRNLANFSIAACARRIVPFIAYISIFEIFGSCNGSGWCEVFAFMETFLAVFEVEWLTHVCIERYVVAKYTTNGWPIQNCHYVLFQGLCLFFASLYSFPPLLGIGDYGFDFSCTFFTFDMILPESWKRYLVITIFLLRSAKPVFVMLMMLTWAIVLERKYICSEESQKLSRFTQNVLYITLVNILCWTPIAFIRGGVIFSQLVYKYPVVMVPAIYVKWAMWIHWVAPAITAAVLFTFDTQIRYHMLHLCTKDHSDAKKEV